MGVNRFSGAKFPSVGKGGDSAGGCFGVPWRGINVSTPAKILVVELNSSTFPKKASLTGFVDVFVNPGNLGNTGTFTLTFMLKASGGNRVSLDAVFPAPVAGVRVFGRAYFDLLRYTDAGDIYFMVRTELNGVYTNQILFYPNNPPKLPLNENLELWVVGVTSGSSLNIESSVLGGCFEVENNSNSWVAN